MKRTRFVAVGLIIGLLLGLSIPAMAISYIDAKQKRQIKALKARVAVIEDAPNTTTGLADEVATLKNRADWQANDISYLYNRTGNLDGNGVYYGVVRRWQVKLSENDGCSNGQPRGATWDSGNLSC